MSDNEDTIEARPQHEGKDPLAGGERLHNASNTSDATTYEVSENAVNAPKAVKQEATPFVLAKPAHKVPNKSKLEQAKVAKARKEKA
jgi:hypothetical protein